MFTKYVYKVLYHWLTDMVFTLAVRQIDQLLSESLMTQIHDVILAYQGQVELTHVEVMYV